MTKKISKLGGGLD